MISNPARVDEVRAEVAADDCQVGVHPRPYVRIEPRLAILRAKDDVYDDFTE